MSKTEILTRRKLLEILGYSALAVGVSACEDAQKRIIPATDEQGATVAVDEKQKEKFSTQVAEKFPSPVPEPTKIPTPVFEKYLVKGTGNLVAIQELYKDKVPALEDDDYYYWYRWNPDALFDPYNIPDGTELIVPDYRKELPKLPEVSTPPEKWQYGYGETWTSLSGSTENRRKNITRAVELINGKIIEPYKLFSVNKTFGPITEKNGFVMGFGYLDNREVPTMGGGICQIPSTLFKTALEAGMLVPERHEHMFFSPRYLPGFDATVSDTFDLTIRNLCNFPFQVRATIDKEKDQLGIVLWADSPLPYKAVQVKTTIDNQIWNDGKIHAEVVQSVVYLDRVRQKNYGSIYTQR